MMKRTHQLSPFADPAVSPDVFDFRVGQPGPNLLPCAFMQQAANQFASVCKEDPLVLQYGVPRGYPQFLEALASFLSDQYGFPVRENELLITSGNSQAIFMASTSIAMQSGRSEIVVEDPTYFLAKEIFKDTGLQIHSFFVDEHGMQVEKLALALGRGELLPAFVYIIPTFHNPTGTNLSYARRSRLLELAKEYNFIILADEPYVFLNFKPGVNETSMMKHEKNCNSNRVISLGSFSKILAPGLRLGWMHASPKLIKKLSSHGVIKSGGGLNPVVSVMVHHAISTGFLSSHIQMCCRVLSQRLLVMLKSIEKYIPTATFHRPHGGYFVWLQFPDTLDIELLLKESKSVKFYPGSRCSMSDRGRSCMRLSFAFYNESEITEGIRLLGQIIAQHNVKYLSAKM